MGKSIGGYHELALPLFSRGVGKQFVLLNSARSALKVIFRSISIKKIWLPAYICDSVVDAVEECGLFYEFYGIDHAMNVPFDLELKSNEYMLHVNYFGLFQGALSRTIDRYGSDNIIVDNSQAFFSEQGDCLATVYSPRKFFGLPDGGLLYSGDSRIQQPQERDQSSENRMAHLISRITKIPENGYQQYLDAEECISKMPVLGMSELTERLLQSIDFESASKARNQNALYLHKKLRAHNRLQFDLSNNVAPLCYPFLPNNNGVGRRHLIEKRIFVPCYWPEVLNRVDRSSFEWDLVSRGLFLPCDQRYNEKDMDYLVSVLGYH